MYIIMMKENAEAVEIFNDVEVYIGEKLLFPTTYAVAKMLKNHLNRTTKE